jgi:cytochrome c-type biogenesis protein CcmH/NrfF
MVTILLVFVPSVAVVIAALVLAVVHRRFSQDLVKTLDEHNEILREIQVRLSEIARSSARSDSAVNETAERGRRT